MRCEDQGRLGLWAGREGPQGAPGSRLLGAGTRGERGEVMEQIRNHPFSHFVLQNHSGHHGHHGHQHDQADQGGGRGDGWDCRSLRCPLRASRQLQVIVHHHHRSNNYIIIIIIMRAWTGLSVSCFQSNCTCLVSLVTCQSNTCLVAQT